MSTINRREGVISFRLPGWVRLAGLFLLVLVVCGCGSVPVAQDLSQKQAQEIVAVLNANGIGAEAHRQTGAGAKYRVEVEHGFYQRAVATLYEQGLPSEERPSFSEIIAQRGLIPNSREVEALRLDRALGAEVEEAISQIPAVSSVRTVVRQHALAYQQPAEAPGVSVVIALRPGSTLAEDEISELVRRMVPGVSPDRVLVASYSARQERVPNGEVGGILSNEGGSPELLTLTGFLWFWHVPDNEYTGLALALCGGLVFFFAVGACTAYSYLRYRSNRNGGRVQLGGGAMSATRYAPKPAARVVDHDSSGE